MSQEPSSASLSNPKAAKIQAEADAKAKKFDWFGLNKEKNQEEASEDFVKAGAQWKLTKHFQNAGDCFKKAAECLMSIGNQVEANTQWREAGKCYRHVDSSLAIDAYNHAIQHFLDDGKFNQAARLHEEIAEMLSEDGKLEESIQQYEKAIDYFETEHDDASASKRIQIIAHMNAKIKKYERAIQLFEKLAKYNADNNLLRWNVKTLLFKAMLCQLNNAADRNDPKAWKGLISTLERYRDMNDLFAQSREYQLCAVLVEVIPACELDKYRTAVAQYDNIVRLEAWATDQISRLEDYIIQKRQEIPNLGGDDALGPDLGADAEEQPNTSDPKQHEVDEKEEIDLENAPNVMDGVF